MTTFIGDITCKIDSKGRVLFPATLKKQITTSNSGSFVIKKDIFENCLILYPIDEWERQVQIIRKKLNPYNREHSKFLRGFYKDTQEVNLDSNNRFLISKNLLNLISAKKEVQLIGLDSKIEIWAKEYYQDMAHNENEFAQLAEKILGNEIF